MRPPVRVIPAPSDAEGRAGTATGRPAETPVRAVSRSSGTSGWPAGYRWTRQREAVVAALREARGSVEAVEVYRMARARGARLSVATVFRTIAELRRRGLIAGLRLAEPVAGRRGAPPAPRESRQRATVLAVLREAGEAGEAIDVDELHRRARERSPRLGRTTVYRALAVLEAPGGDAALAGFDSAARETWRTWRIGGTRLTRQRRLVQRVVEQAGAPLTLEELHRRVREHDSGVPRGTIERAVAVLRERPID